MDAKKIFETIGRMKLYFNNVGTYLSIVNFTMLMLTFKKVYDIKVNAFWIALTGLVVIFIVGFIDYKLIYRHQLKEGNRMNDMKIQLDRIEEKLKKIKT